MAEDAETDQFLLAKAAVRASVAPVINRMLNAWRGYPDARLQTLQGALIAALADLTAECALGTRAPTKEQFLRFMERSYDQAARDHDGDAP